MIAILVYGVAVFAIWRNRKKFRTDLVRRGILAAAICGYFAAYIPSVQRYLEFRGAESASRPVATGLQDRRKNYDGVFIPHLACTEICREILLNRHSTYVETATWTKDGIAPRDINKTSSLLRWTLRTGKENCAPESVIGELSKPAYLKDGKNNSLPSHLCYVPERVESGNAELRFEATRDNAPLRLTTFEAFLLSGQQRSRVAARTWRYTEVLVFPLFPYLKVNYAPTGIGLMRRRLTDGKPSLKAFYTAATGLEFSLRSLKDRRNGLGFPPDIRRPGRN